jgi:23S rRNA (cytidine1920-2'-O)/16S rRNA (cytidine1409-2'-O)-methyltransferase
VRRGLAESRERAQAAIADGRILVGGVVAEKAARQVDPGEAIVVRGDGPRFVSRGGQKLDAALHQFAVDPTGRRVLDAGASTGGFSDCVLQRGAREVVAVDVGYGQLHEKVRTDARVRAIDRTNVRYLTPADVGGPVDLVVADLSFISLALVARTLVRLTAPGADLVVLVKPQFEAGRQVVSKGRGIVTDPTVWRDSLGRVAGAFVEGGSVIMGAMVSPITGADGNVEFLLHARIDDDRVDDRVEWVDDALDGLLDAVVAGLLEGDAGIHARGVR